MKSKTIKKKKKTGEKEIYVDLTDEAQQNEIFIETFKLKPRKMEK